ncbi:hypothetical protein GOBAR_DD10314 [Gossypium barbadense]|nr:hypothetical protein GOBAR_DD10314 [Gossypium barbadense]
MDFVLVERQAMNVVQFNLLMEMVHSMILESKVLSRKWNFMNAIRELMQVDGLTNDKVKSHLQKYWLHTRRLPATTTTTIPANQSGLVLGGGHAWMCQDQFGESSKGSSSQSGSP